MQIELIGCTSAGKTTLARKMLRAGQALGIDVQLSDDFILECVRLNWIKNDFLRRRVIELWALLTCLTFWGKYSDLYGVIFRTCFKVRGSWFYKIKLARVALKKIGIFQIVRSRSSEQQVIVLDNEGVLQATHTLFVHIGSINGASNLSAFLRLAPLPEVIAYLRQSEPVLIERTCKRGHNRIPEGADSEDVAVFIRRTVAIFEELARHPRLADRLLVLDPERSPLLTGDHFNNRQLAKAAKLIREAMIVATPADNELELNA
ncbi:MAG: hypothetical protein L0Z68_03270 [Gammaproteobacteria bacterium]|nr:hypothetical protein [Gammaproteobacteria bacterium]